MCDQSNPYMDGDVVWVKLGNCWWPGEICGESRQPDGLLSSVKKQPIAVVKYFQEDNYEFVRNINNIYKYNCRRREEFIRKGVSDLHRTPNNKNMRKFPSDVKIAELLTGGDPDIINSLNCTPGQRTSYGSIFGNASQRKPEKEGGHSQRKRKISEDEEELIAPITHRRFISKEQGGVFDHRTKILEQPRCSAKEQPSTSRAAHTSSNIATGAYKCHACQFTSNRLNVIVLHSKEHTLPKHMIRKGKKPATVTTLTARQSTIPIKKIQIPQIKKQNLVLTVDSDSSKPTTSTMPCTNDPEISQKKIPTATYSNKRKQKVTENEKSIEAKEPTPIAKKPKIDVKIRSWLADWSEDESDNDVSDPVLNAKKATNPQSSERKPTSANQGREALTSSGSGENSGSSSLTQKYRNIPKKDRRDIVLKEFSNGDLKANATEKAMDASKKPILERVDDVIVKSSDNSSDPPILRAEEDSLGESVDDTPSIESFSTASSADEELLEAEQRFWLRQQAMCYKQLSESPPTLQAADRLIGQTTDVKCTPKNTAKAPLLSSEDRKEKPPSPKSINAEKSLRDQILCCFDFEDDDDDDEENESLSSFNKLKQKFMPPQEKCKETATAGNNLCDDSQLKDQELTNQIENLLISTKPTDIKLKDLDKQIQTKVTTGTGSNSPDIKGLPPKERGKRFFKSRIRRESSAEVLTSNVQDVSSALQKSDHLKVDKTYLKTPSLSVDAVVTKDKKIEKGTSSPIKPIIIDKSEVICIDDESDSSLIEELPKENNSDIPISHATSKVGSKDLHAKSMERAERAQKGNETSSLKAIAFKDDQNVSYETHRFQAEKNSEKDMNNDMKNTDDLFANSDREKGSRKRRSHIKITPRKIALSFSAQGPSINDSKSLEQESKILDTVTDPISSCVAQDETVSEDLSELETKITEIVNEGSSVAAVKQTEESENSEEQNAIKSLKLEIPEVSRSLMEDTRVPRRYGRSKSWTSENLPTQSSSFYEASEFDADYAKYEPNNIIEFISNQGKTTSTEKAKTKEDAAQKVTSTTTVEPVKAKHEITPCPNSELTASGVSNQAKMTFSSQAKPEKTLDIREEMMNSSCAELILPKEIDCENYQESMIPSVETLVVIEDVLSQSTIQQLPEDEVSLAIEDSSRASGPEILADKTKSQDIEIIATTASNRRSANVDQVAPEEFVLNPEKPKVPIMPGNDTVRVIPEKSVASKSSQSDDSAEELTNIKTPNPQPSPAEFTVFEDIEDIPTFVIEKKVALATAAEEPGKQISAFKQKEVPKIAKSTKTVKSHRTTPKQSIAELLSSVETQLALEAQRLENEQRVEILKENESRSRKQHKLTLSHVQEQKASCRTFQQRQIARPKTNQSPLTTKLSDDCRQMGVVTQDNRIIRLCQSNSVVVQNIPLPKNSPQNQQQAHPTISKTLQHNQGSTGSQRLITSKGSGITADAGPSSSNSVTTTAALPRSTATTVVSTAPQMMPKVKLNVKPLKSDSQEILVHSTKNQPQQKKAVFARQKSWDTIELTDKELDEVCAPGYFESRPEAQLLTSHGYKQIQLKKMKEQQAVPPLASTSTNLSQPQAQATDSENTIKKDVQNVTQRNVVTQSLLKRNQQLTDCMQQGPLQPKAQVVTTAKQPTTTIVAAAGSSEGVLAAKYEGSNILAVQGESLGGPPGSYYLCLHTDGEEFFPVDERPLFIDEEGRLVPANGTEADSVDRNIPHPTAIDTVVALESVRVTIPEVVQLADIANNQMIAQSDDESQHAFIIHAEGYRISLDRDSLLSLVTSATEEGAQLMTSEGHQIFLPPELLASIKIQLGHPSEQILISDEDAANSDILAAALAGSDVFQTEQPVISDVLQFGANILANEPPQNSPFPPMAPPITALTNETNALLKQPPIMSTLEVPSHGAKSLIPGVVSSRSSGFSARTNSLSGTPVLCGNNIEDSLAVIGVTRQTSSVPSSLELPITVTNPAIAPKPSVGSLTNLYSTSSILGHANQISPASLSADIVGYDIFASNSQNSISDAACVNAVAVAGTADADISEICNVANSHGTSQFIASRLIDGGGIDDRSFHNQMGLQMTSTVSNDGNTSSVSESFSGVSSSRFRQSDDYLEQSDEANPHERDGSR